MSRSLAILACMLLLAGCTLGRGATANPTPVLVSITQGVESCGDVIRAALEQPYCPRVNAVCYALAEYDPANPLENVVSRGVVGDIEEIGAVGPLDERTSRVEGGIHWETYSIYREGDDIDLTLITLGGVSLAGISPALDALTLSTDGQEAVCEDAPPAALLVRANLADSPLTLNGVQISVGGLLVAQAKAEALTIYAVDALSVVSAAGVSRVVRDGEQTRVVFGEDGEPGEPAPATVADGAVVAAFPLGLVRNGDVERAVPDDGTGQTAERCMPRADWTGEHIVARGENLARIAPLYDVTIADLQQANCLQNPNRLSVGQVLRVPGDEPTLAPAETVTIRTPPVLPTSTMSSASRFTVEIDGTSCATLRWDVPDAARAELDGEPVPVRGQQDVCPSVTTVYRLRVVYADGRQETLTRSVVVSAN